MSEALRKACKVELENVRNLTDGYEEELDRLVAFAKQQRVAVWKEAARHCKTLIDLERCERHVRGDAVRAYEVIADHFDKQAKELKS